VENDAGESIGQATSLDSLANRDRRRRKLDPVVAAPVRSETRMRHAFCVPPRAWRYRAASIICSTTCCNWPLMNSDEPSLQQLIARGPLLLHHGNRLARRKVFVYHPA
jgi:hypothetical protein